MLSEERTKLLEDASEIKIGPAGFEDERLLNLIKRYNDGTISRADIKRDLDEIVGKKRKVAVRVETDERTYIVVLPLPLFVFLLPRFDIAPHAVYVHFIPGPIGQLDHEQRGQAQQIGCQLRNEYYDRVFPRRDVIKGYSGKKPALPGYRDEVVREARHWRKRESRIKTQLELDLNQPLQERIDALAFVVDRYLRMTPTLMAERNFLGVNRARDYDLVNIYQDPEALQGLLNQIAQPNINNIRPELRDNYNEPVMFRFGACRNRQNRAGLEQRRLDVYQAWVIVNNQNFIIDRAQLTTLANRYLTEHPIVIRRTI